MTSHDLRSNAPNIRLDLTFEHITCPKEFCGLRQTPTCEKNCQLYKRFILMMKDAADEVF